MASSTHMVHLLIIIIIMAYIYSTITLSSFLVWCGSPSPQEAAQDAAFGIVRENDDDDGTSLGTNNIPALFLFGDSIADTGNNNWLFTLARADFYPYGKNFVDRVPTGRFCDGLLAVDYLGTKKKRKKKDKTSCLMGVGVVHSSFRRLFIAIRVLTVELD